VNGISVTSEKYNRALESLDVKIMEEQFTKILHAIYNGQN
jgi:hypothetical protein